MVAGQHEKTSREICPTSPRLKKKNKQQKKKKNHNNKGRQYKTFLGQYQEKHSQDRGTRTNQKEQSSISEHVIVENFFQVKREVCLQILQVCLTRKMNPNQRIIKAHKIFSVTDQRQESIL